LTQNYKLLGLSSRLNAATGGSEKKPIPSEHDGNQHRTDDVFSMPKSRKTTKLVPTETKVERDPQTGRILRIVRSDGGSEDATTRKRKLNPLNDPLEDLSDEGETNARSTGPTEVVAKLEALADEEAMILAKKRRPRQQSKREEEWIARLVEKYGDDTRAMARDVRLNPMQQSEGDLARRLKKWKENRQIND
jgi:nucleolar protein 16